MVVSEELYTKQRKVGGFLLLRLGNRVDLHVYVFQRLSNDSLIVVRTN